MPLILLMLQTVMAASESYRFGVAPQHFASAGLMSGLSTSDINTGAYLGLEGGYLRASPKGLFGLTGDLLYDFSQDSTTLSLGPKIGKLVLGIDGGLALRHRSETDLEMGGQLRGSLNVGLLSLSYRNGYWPASVDLKHSHQIGLTIKIPQSLSHDARKL